MEVRKEDEEALKRRVIYAMMEINEKAFAKLNISLDVSNARPDGYHDMRMVMQTVSLYDNVRIILNETGGVFARMSCGFIPGDDRNLAVRAAKRFLEAAGREKAGVEMRIKKAIPVGAGMAGGSADAAAVLRGLNTLFGNPFDRDRLLKIAETIGSDVAFCTLGGTALAEGRGERLTPLEPFPECLFLICKPPFSISTPELFKALDRQKIRARPDTDGILEALMKGNTAQICRRMYNVFEDVDDRRMKTVSRIKSILLDGGATGAVMTGTGSAVFGVFPVGSDVSALRERLKREYGFCAVAEPVPKLL